MEKQYALKYRIYPTEDQKKFLNLCFAVKRKVWNHILEYDFSYYEEHGKRVKQSELSRQMTEFVNLPDNKWMKQGIRRSLDIMLFHSYKNAWKRFFEDLKTGKVAQRKAKYIERKKAGGGKIDPNKLRKLGMPKSKNWSDKQSFQLDRPVEIDFAKKMIFLPKLKGGISIKIGSNDNILNVFDAETVKKTQKAKYCIPNKDIAHKLRTVTFSRTQSGKYYLSIGLKHEHQPDKPKKKEQLEVDLGVRYSAVTSDGVYYVNPRFLQTYNRRIKRLQKKLSRQEKGSNNWKKTKRKLAKTHERVANLRKDYIQRMTTEIIRKGYKKIAIEDISSSEMIYVPLPEKIEEKEGFKQNNRKLHALFNRLLLDASIGEIQRCLEYKSEWNGIDLVKTEKGMPTNRECSNCGEKNDIKPSDFTWKCVNCGIIHQKNVNSLKVIRKYRDKGH